MGFLDLPGELRNEIYRFVLIPTTECVSDPWSLPPPSSRFNSLLSLALSNHQISAEVTSLFHKEFAGQVRLHFNDIMKLHDFHQWAMRRERLKTIKFNLRVNVSKPFLILDHADYIAEFDERQMCWLLINHMGPNPSGWFSDETFIFMGRSDDGNLIVPTGFHVTERVHNSDLIDGQWCHHLSLHHPPFKKSLTLTSHFCHGNARNAHSGWTCEEFEGQLQDLDFTPFDIAALRAHRYHQTRSLGHWGPFDYQYERWRDETEFVNETIDYTYYQPSEPDSWQATEDEESDDGLDTVETSEAP